MSGQRIDAVALLRDKSPDRVGVPQIMAARSPGDPAVGEAAAAGLPITSGRFDKRGRRDGADRFSASLLEMVAEV
jgi:hypothetical protein